MKKYLFFILVIPVCISCQKQETSKPIKTISSTPVQPKDSLMEKFNIQEFNKHQKNDEWEYIDKDGNEIRNIKDGNEGYIIKITNNKNIFDINKYFYPNGNIAQKSFQFHGNAFIRGVMTDYDEKGNIIKQTDYDAPYKDYPWEKVKVWMESKNIDLLDPLTRVWREIDNDKPIWYISWDTKKLDKYSNQIIQNVEINGKTGEIIKEYTSSFGEEIPEKYR
ncbi:hypothetical protein ETU08_02165 [Apibacter muscae]|uniref:hypothetical protein n=1 Tax=Apibacter muscae TaxID=2509004 RepID=UPI0011AC3FE1|nr:hypothetical protein [Apibacter muscae]TWP30831.1 hypothetical protein ETU08_02165 [Apibacter muscae]